MKFINAVGACLLMVSPLFASDIHLSLRAMPSEDEITLVCRITNASDSPIRFRDPFLEPVPSVARARGGFYGFRYIQLHDSARNERILTSRPTSRADPFVTVPSGESRIWKIQKRNFSAMTQDFLTSNYTMLSWIVSWGSALGSTPYMLLGVPDENGNMKSPAINPNTKQIELFLGLIDHENQGPDIGLLLLNGTEENVVIDNSLNITSRIVVSMPAIEYMKVFPIPNEEAVEVIIVSGEVRERRIPWQTILRLMPDEDLAKIYEAGGDIDIVWKVGESKSAPLLLTLPLPSR